MIRPARDAATKNLASSPSAEPEGNLKRRAENHVSECRPAAPGPSLFENAWVSLKLGFSEGSAEDRDGKKIRKNKQNLSGNTMQSPIAQTSLAICRFHNSILTAEQ